MKLNIKKTADGFRGYASCKTTSGRVRFTCNGKSATAERLNNILKERGRWMDPRDPSGFKAKQLKEKKS
jgi:hypothetical protein